MSNLLPEAGDERSMQVQSICEPTSNEDKPPMGTVLVVEDEPAIHEPLTHSLRKAGFKVLLAEDGLSACRLIGSKQPDLILLDIMLPNLDGWEVCLMLRQHPDPVVANIPVVMLTAMSAPENKYRGLEIGADVFLTKPYSIREVILLASNMIQRRQQTVELNTRVISLTDEKKQSQNLNHLLFHELSNQLLILNGYTELLHNDSDGSRTAMCLDAISRSSDYLQTLAEEVLLIRQVEDGRLSLRYDLFLIEDLIAEIIKLYGAPAREKSVQVRSLVATKQSSVNLNRMSVKIILSTLVDNALKYGSDGQIITLSCNLNKDRIELEVVDQGPGIPAEEQEKIFEEYYRSGDTQGKPHGRGLGLHAVKVLTKAMGGDVTVESRTGHGSRFRVDLPA